MIKKKDLSKLKNDVDNFIANNEERYAIISSFSEQILNFTEDTYHKIISFVEEHSSFFFKDHINSILFISIIQQCSLSTWKKLEQIYDILLYFLPQLKNSNITDNDFITIYKSRLISINILYLKQIISIDSIVQESYHSNELFVYFLPEIDQYDSEYVKKKQETLLIMDFANIENSEELKKLFHLAKNNPEQHIINRNKGYDPTPLHESIREDDIDTFQSLLSKNNFDVNHHFEFSFYERHICVDTNPSLIQIAAVYGSIKIFKYLWMQTNIILDDNLLGYAIFGRNYEIIHTCESKCNCGESLIYSILVYDQELIDYNYENHLDQAQITPDDLEIQEKMKEIDLLLDVSDRKYNDLAFTYLKNSIHLMNIPIILDNLYKILYIVENFDGIYPMNLIMSSVLDFPLFEFLYSHKNEKLFPPDGNQIAMGFFEYACSDSAFYTVEYVLSKLDYDEFNVIFNCLTLDNHFAKLVLDEIMKLKNSGKKSDSKIVDSFQLNDNVINVFNQAAEYFDMEVIIMFLRVNDMFSNMECLFNFITQLKTIASNKMIISLFDKLIDFLPNDVLRCFIPIFAKYGYKQASDFIIEKMKTKT